MKKKSSLRNKINLFQSNSQQKGVGRKSLLFSSKLVMLAMALIIIGAAFGAFAILQHSRDSKAATGMILNIPFDTDFSGQGLQRVSSDRLRIVSQADNGVKPVQGAGMARIELRKGDNPLAQWCCANTARSEFTTQTNEQKGENRWYSWSSMFDPTFPSYPTQPANGGWQIFLQWHGNDSVSPPMAFFASNDNIALGVSDGSRWNYYWQAPMNRGSWHNFKMHVTWGDSGRIELWHNGSKVLDKSGVDNITSPPLYVKGGMYRNDDLAKTAILYMDSFKMAWDEASLGSVPTNNTGTPVVPTQTAPAPTPTVETNTASPSPAPTPVATSSTLAPNDWSKWEKGEGVVNSTVSTPMTLSNSRNLLVQFDSNKRGYKSNQYGRYCIARPAGSAVPKSITFTANVNAKYGNTVYFYADDSDKKLWTIDNTGGKTQSKTATVTLGQQSRYCFGNVSIPSFGNSTYGSSRLIQVTNYKFNY